MTRRSSPDFYRQVLDSVHDGVYFVDRQRRITYWNTGAARITGYSASAVIGRCCTDNLLVHIDARGCQLCQNGCPLTAAMTKGAPHEANIFLRHRDGHRIPVAVRVVPVRDRDGTIAGAVETFSDNTRFTMVERRLHDLHRAALTDPLTGLGNRRYIDAKAEVAMIERRAGVACGALFIDIDHFKHINDTMGHAVGDRVLKLIAKSLRDNLRETDVIGRYGGEEFVALLQGIDTSHLVTVAETLRIMVAQSRLHLPDADVEATVSIGATMVRANEPASEMLARADSLLYRSKQEGRNRVTTGH